MTGLVEGRIEIFQGDITSLAVEAVVNAANAALEPGGGVCGAIHRAAGPGLARACRALGRCPTGQARITPGFGLRARHVIHAVGPRWQGGGAGEAGLLAAAYLSALELARDAELATLAFPALSTGIYGYPLEQATAIAVRTVRGFLARSDRPQKVVFAVFGPEAEAAYRQALAAA